MKAVQLRIVEEIAGTLYQTDGAFRKHAAELGYTRKAMAAIALEAEDLFAKGGYALSQLGENHRRLLAWLDRWVVIRPAGDGTLGQIVFRSKGDRHIETNKW